MILRYQTAKLPANFLILGILLIAIGLWRIIVSDWVGIILLVAAFVFIFLEFGIEIDTNAKKLKKYIGLFFIITGKWEDISTISHLFITSVKQTQSMNVVTINRIETEIAYKLFMVSLSGKIELATGKKEFIDKMAGEIAAGMQTTIKTVDNKSV
jgi:hypothetical protein